MVISKLLLVPHGRAVLSGLPNVVTHVECRFVASEGDSSASVSVPVVLLPATPDNFKPVEDCTAADYLDFIKAAKGGDFDAWKAEMEARALFELSPPPPFSLPAVEVPDAS